MTDHTDNTESPKSRSQIKREMTDLQKTGERLLDLPLDQLETLSDRGLVEAVIACKKIKKNSAMKRQLQYIGKLMRNTDSTAVRDLLDQFDARTRQSQQHFHKLERWRAGLISDDKQVMDEILQECPQVNRQHLRQLVRRAATDQTSPSNNLASSRKLFRYLREIVEIPSSD